MRIARKKAKNRLPDGTINEKIAPRAAARITINDK